MTQYLLGASRKFAYIFDGPDQPLFGSLWDILVFQYEIYGGGQILGALLGKIKNKLLTQVHVIKIQPIRVYKLFFLLLK